MPKYTKNEIGNRKNIRFSLPIGFESMRGDSLRLDLTRHRCRRLIVKVKKNEKESAHERL